MVLHQEKNVFFISSLKAHREPLSERDSWIISQLGSVFYRSLNGDDSTSVAESLFHLFTSSFSFEALSRICLVRATPGTRLLEVVDVKSREHQGTENKMKKGYRCFVSENSSLFSLRPGSVRVYNQIDQVLNSFKIENKPIQRSIRLISEMNHRSGLVLPLHAQGEVIGFLFMNSFETNYFEELSGARAQLLSAVCIFANTYLNVFQGSSFGTPVDSTRLPVTSKNFSAMIEFLQRDLEQNLGRSLKIELDGDLSNGISAVRNLGLFLSHFLSLAMKNEDSIILSVKSEAPDRKKIGIHGLQPLMFSDGTQLLIHSIARFLGLEYQKSTHGIPEVLFYSDPHYFSETGNYSI